MITQVLGRDEAVKRLESVVHPLVSEAREEFYSAACDAGEMFVVFDIPLLL
jgi:dephospho-CoA kinase